MSDILHLHLNACPTLLTSHRNIIIICRMFSFATRSASHSSLVRSSIARIHDHFMTESIGVTGFVSSTKLSASLPPSASSTILSSSLPTSQCICLLAQLFVKDQLRNNDAVSTTNLSPTAKYQLFHLCLNC